MHDGIAFATCDLLLVGESVNPSGPAVLRSVDGGGTFDRLRPPAQATRLRRIVGSDRTHLWLWADDVGGQPIVARSDDGGTSWATEPLPREIASVTDLALGPEGLLLAAVVGVGAAIFSRDDRTGGWTEITHFGVAGSSARISQLVVEGSRVLVAGTDDSHGVALLSGDGGKSFERTADPSFLRIAQTIGSGTADAVIVGGYEGARPEEGQGVIGIASSSARSWDRIVIAGATQLTNLRLVGDRGLALVSTGHGDAAVRSTDGGRSWSAIGFDSPARRALVLERLVFSPDGTVYAVGAGSPLFRTHW